jgi:phosphoribosylformimino-5-aminoimidazole carboxamide ribotide isomerase
MPEQLGFFRFLCTDINKDGKLGGAGIELMKNCLTIHLSLN